MSDLPQKIAEQVAQAPNTLMQKVQSMSPRISSDKTTLQSDVQKLVGSVAVSPALSKIEQLQQNRGQLSQWINSDSDDRHVDDQSLSDIDSIDYVIVDAKPKTSTDFLLENFFGDITIPSACRQFVIGGAFGWASGYLGIKIGQLAALGLGGTLLLMQIAQYNGIIHINWTRVQHALTRAQARFKNEIMKHRQSVYSKVKTFYEENTFLAAGFVTGLAVAIFW